MVEWHVLAASTEQTEIYTDRCAAMLGSLILMSTRTLERVWREHEFQDPHVCCGCAAFKTGEVSELFQSQIPTPFQREISCGHVVETLLVHGIQPDIAKKSIVLPTPQSLEPPAYASLATGNAGRAIVPSSPGHCLGVLVHLLRELTKQKPLLTYAHTRW